VFVDTFQLWGTENLLADIARAAGRIFGVHVADSPERLRAREDRLVPGEGVIPLRELLGAIHTTGYAGRYDVELMSQELWASDYDDVLRRCAQGLTDLLLSLEEAPAP
jgi:sugar phosphate isomerase/epimerase